MGIYSRKNELSPISMLLSGNGFKLTSIYRNTLSIDVKVTVTSYAWLRLVTPERAKSGHFYPYEAPKWRVRLWEVPNPEAGLQA